VHLVADLDDLRLGGEVDLADVRATSSAPKRSACVRMSSMSWGPCTPSAKPGKFSTSVVVISAPPNCEPSNTSGWRFARAA
jgi:hypothetical protein